MFHVQEAKDVKKEREDASDILYDSLNPFMQTETAMPLASPTSVLSMQSSASTELPPSEDSQQSNVLLPRSKEDDEVSHMDCSQSTCSSMVHLAADITDQSSQMSVSSCRSHSSDQWLTEWDLMAGGNHHCSILNWSLQFLIFKIFFSEKVPEMLLMAEEEEDYEIDPCALSPFSSGVQSSNGEPQGPAGHMIDRLLSSYKGNNDVCYDGPFLLIFALFRILPHAVHRPN